MKLKNKVVVITGASDGIGKEIALRLAQEECILVLVARNEEKLAMVAQKAKEIGSSKVVFYSCDVSDTKKLEETVGVILANFGTLDVLINNAGIRQKLMPVDQLEGETIDKIIATNLSAVIHTTRLFLPALRLRDESIIINIVSKSGVLAQKGQSVYTATKYGVRGFTEVLKLDLKGTNVKVAGIYQGGTDTNMFQKAGENISTENFTNPADLADVVAYMLSCPDKIWLHDVRVDR